MLMQDIRFKYADTISINSKKQAYISKGILSRQGIYDAINYVLIDFAQSNEYPNIELRFYESNLPTSLKLFKNGRGYTFSLSSALTTLGIYKVQKLTRVPFGWIGNRMIVDVKSLLCLS